MNPPLKTKLGPEAARLFIRTCERILEDLPGNLPMNEALAKLPFRGMEILVIGDFYLKWKDKAYLADSRKKPLSITFTIAELHAFYHTLVDYTIPTEGTEEERIVTQRMIAWTDYQIVNQTYKQTFLAR